MFIEGEQANVSEPLMQEESIEYEDEDNFDPLTKPEKYFELDTRNLLTENDKERIRIGFITPCEVDPNCKCHANQKCDACIIWPIYGDIWRGCNKNFCYRCATDEYKTNIDIKSGKQETVYSLTHCKDEECQLMWDTASCRAKCCLFIIVILILYVIVHFSGGSNGSGSTLYLEQSAGMKAGN